jgi:putative tryptophan/tyrosine transport system substrate-binding protein
MIDRRTFLAGTGALFLAVPLAAEAQQSTKVARVGVLGAGPTPSADELAKSVSSNPLWLSMRQLGWRYGENMIVERRFGESPTELRAGAADLVRLKVDVLFVGGAGLAKLLQLETKTIPIVVSAPGVDLVAAGLIDSLAKPGGNVTGVQSFAYDLVSKRLELLKTLVPGPLKVAVLQDDTTFSEVPQLRSRYDEQAAIAARALGIELHTFVLHRAGEFAAAFTGMKKNRDRGLLVMTTPFMFAHRKEIIDLAAAHRIAAVYEHHLYVRHGGLMCYGVDLAEMSRRAAVYLDRILRGAKPADLPVEQPTKFELVINLKTAKALGLTIPPSLLGRADEVIQ